ncbi:MAG TPA: CBS domain-containing protein [Myxococcota bacterium]|nr:CBS domain-containing protein [Myxococcota bacterium]
MDAATRLVSEIMQTDFVTVSLHDRLDFADQVMRLGRIRHLPVLHQGRVVGIVSNRDILAASLTKVLQFGPIERRAFLRSIDVEEVMTSRIYTVPPKATLEEAAQLLLRHKIGCLPVVDPAGAPVGLITETDLLRAAFLPEEPKPRTEAEVGAPASGS